MNISPFLVRDLRMPLAAYRRNQPRPYSFFLFPYASPYLDKFISSLSKKHVARSYLMRHLKKRQSWPPIRKARVKSVYDSIDADPFAYFVSASEDSHSDAGIKNRPRSHSLPSLHGRARVPLSNSAHEKSPTARLKRWIERMEKLYAHRAKTDVLPLTIELIEPREPPELPQPKPIYVTRSPPIRGRGYARSTSHQRVPPNARTPPRRPRAWREPSSEIWPVAEENEEVGLGITA